MVDAPKRKKHVPLMKPDGIVIGSTVVPVAPTPVLEEGGQIFLTMIKTPYLQVSLRWSGRWKMSWLWLSKHPWTQPESKLLSFLGSLSKLFFSSDNLSFRGKHPGTHPGQGVPWTISFLF